MMAWPQIDLEGSNRHKTTMLFIIIVEGQSQNQGIGFEERTVAR
jgi:hypothetical protein